MRIRQAGSFSWAGALLGVALLIPFADKPLHVDDPVYVWVARHILEDPLDFYGLELNWHGSPERVADFNKNPPGVSFYLAPLAALVGWGRKQDNPANFPASL